jgi:hypothetical protein
MTTKEKAKELVEKFKKVELYHSMEPTDFDCNIEDITSSSYTAKQCALICLEELFISNTKESKHNYWIDVREEIEKL